MNSFELARPTTLAEAAQMLAEKPAETAALAGGQDLLALLKDDVLAPSRLVNLKGLPGLGSIEVDRQGALVLGALVSLDAVASSPLVQKGWAVVAAAAAAAATPQIRNIGTVGGNLCQQPRCWYYRAAELHCARKGGEACLAVVGDHSLHSIFGEVGCLAPNMSALANPGTCLGGSLRLHGPQGARTVSLVDFYAPLKQSLATATALRPGEFVTHLVLPAATGWATAHEEVRARQSSDWPLAMATAALRLTGGNVTAARLTLGALAPLPWVADAEVAVLQGKRPTLALCEQAAAVVVGKAAPLPLNEYKVTITRHLVRRVLARAAGLGEG
ncbi:MAG: FAD binding domain-containing protein [Fimbriimonadaceae bacterium]|nr:FAD binding domain-containing protein [Fimbriimonadaceae bacterium]